MIYKRLIRALAILSLLEAYIYLAGIRMRQQEYKSAAIILDQALVLNPIHKIGNMMKSELNQIK